MNRMTHFGATCVAVLTWALTLVLVFAPAAAGAQPCDQRMIDDWSADGRIDGVYKLHCYEDAIAALPLELRDYSDLVDVIRRSQSSAVIDTDAHPRAAAAIPVVDTSGSSPFPLPLLLLTAVSLGLVAAGALSYLIRRPARGRRGPSG
jgi:hypothetical protein